MCAPKVNKSLRLLCVSPPLGRQRRRRPRRFDAKKSRNQSGCKDCAHKVRGHLPKRIQIQNGKYDFKDSNNDSFKSQNDLPKRECYFAETEEFDCVVDRANCCE